MSFCRQVNPGFRQQNVLFRNELLMNGQVKHQFWHWNVIFRNGLVCMGKSIPDFQAMSMKNKIRE